MWPVQAISQAAKLCCGHQGMDGASSLASSPMLLCCRPTCSCREHGKFACWQGGPGADLQGSVLARTSYTLTSLVVVGTRPEACSLEQGCKHAEQTLFSPTDQALLMSTGQLLSSSTKHTLASPLEMPASFFSLSSSRYV